MTAVSGAEILERGVADFDALAQSIPGVSMQTGGPGQTSFHMRGGAPGINSGVAPTVGFYLADIPLTAWNGAIGQVVIDPNLYDLNRVEVLRGPQGTLYGSSSMGGAIKVIPNAPSTAGIGASAQTIFSGTDGGGFNHSENGMLNLPLLNGTAALRVVASHEHESGWLDRIVIAQPYFPLETNNLTTRGNVLAAPVAADYKGVNDENLTGVRVALLWQPTEKLAVTPSYFYQSIKQGGPNQIDSNPGTDAHYQPFNEPEPFSDRFDLASLDIKYAFDAFDLTSTTAWWSRDLRVTQDGDEEVQFILSKPTAIEPFYTSQGGIGGANPTPYLDQTFNQTSEEVRLASSGKSRFQWLVGYFYDDLSSTQFLQILYPGSVQTFGTANQFTAIFPFKSVQNSFFGELSYQLTPQLKATAGVRRYSYQDSQNLTDFGWLLGPPVGARSYSSGSASNSGLSPKYDISYEMGKNLLLYGTIAKGFRPGGPNYGVQTGGPSTCEPALQSIFHTSQFVPSSAVAMFGPDSLWSYELGEKASILDRRVTINSAAYFEDWNAVQQGIGLTCGAQITVNAGVAHIYGGETEINAVLLQGLILSANAGYTHATIVSEAVISGIPTGTQLQDVPEWTSSVSLAYHHSISDSLAFTARVENNYVGSRTDQTATINHLPSYDLTNLRVGLEGNRWTAVLFAKNLFNERALLNNAFQGVNEVIPTFNRTTVSQPLTVGIDLRYQFGR